jgi:Ca2+-binding EF-hand superfamily protein
VLVPVLCSFPAQAQPPRGDRPAPPGITGGFDPTRIFDGWDQNRDGLVTRDELRDRRSQGRFDEYVRRANITDGRLTRDAFLKAFQQRIEEQTRARYDPNRIFRDLDRNRDGRLDALEIQRSSRLRAEAERWDANRDGIIVLDEFRPYVEARFQGQRPGSGMPFGQGIASGATNGTGNTTEVAGGYRAGKLPPNFPSWFTELDQDADGQVALHEWKGRPLDEFLPMDRNKDGFITIEEVLRHEAASKDASAKPGN